MKIMIYLSLRCCVLTSHKISAVHHFYVIVHVLKAVSIVTSEHLNLSTIFLVSHLLSAKVWRLNLGFGTQRKCPFPLRIEVSLQ